MEPGKKQIEEENIDNIRKEKEECFSESMLGALSGGSGDGQQRGGGRACLIEGCFVRGCVHDNEVSFQRHVEAFIKQDIYGKVGNFY